MVDVSTGLRVVVLAAWAVSSAVANDDVHGWAQTVWGPGGRTVVHAPSASFALEAGETWHPAAGLDVALTTFEGVVDVPDGDESYALMLEVEGGAASIVVDGDEGRLATRLTSGAWVKTAWLPSAEDELRVRITFHRHGDGPARLRTLWERSEEFFLHPASPLLFHEVRVPDEHVDAVRADRSTRDGRALLDSKGCVNCHAPGDSGLTSPTVAPGWPGLARVAEWASTGAPLHADFDVPWLTADERAALATFLEHGPEPVDVDEGRELFDRVGCVACHGPFALIGTQAAAVPLRPSTSWTRSSMRNLFDGERHVAVDLDGGELEAVAAALAERGGDGSALGDPRLGGRLYTDLGCAACHEALDGSTRAPDGAPSLTELSPVDGCLKAVTTTFGGDDLTARKQTYGAHPRYLLPPDELDAVRDALAQSSRWTPHPSPADALDRALVGNDCLSCHARDGRGGPAAAWRPFFTTVDEEVDLGDEGRLPPDLTDIGARMTTHAMRDVIVHGARARPWMATRMPLYEERGDGVAELLSRTAGLWPDAQETWPDVDDRRVLDGRRLVGSDGMNCISCHLFGDRDSAGSPGVAIDGMAGRLRYEWFASWMHDPQRMRPGTRMPAFATANVSAIEDLHDGDFARQLDDLWAYLTLGEFAPVPAGLEASDDVIVDVGARPRVVRTFLDDAGARGIAVGYPVGVHAAYDAGAARFVAAWEGDFLDASGAWSARGGNVSGGRGPTIWEAGDGPALVVTSNDVAPSDTDVEAWVAGRRFGGYHLAPDGTPTFMSRGDVGPLVGERLVPDLGRRRLVRTWTFPDGLPQGAHAWLRDGDAWRRVENPTDGVTQEIDW